MDYDSWLEKPYRDQDAANARFERHLETCERCIALERDRHDELCVECDHPWHGQDLCTWEHNETGLRSCECEESPLLKDSTIGDLENKCCDDTERDAYADYCDRKYDEWKDRQNDSK